MRRFFDGRPRVALVIQIDDLAAFAIFGVQRTAHEPLQNLQRAFGGERAKHAREIRY